MDQTISFGLGDEGLATIQGLWGFVAELLCAQRTQPLVLLLADIAFAELQLLLGSGVTIWLMGNLSYAYPSIQEKPWSFYCRSRLFGTIFLIGYGAATIPQVYKDFKKKRLTFASI